MEMNVETKRSNERARAKNNRQQFRNLIELLNKYVYDERLNTNRCLSMTTSTLQLVKYIEKTKCKQIYDDKANLNNRAQEILVDVVTVESVDQHLPQIQSSSMEYQSGFLVDEFSIDLLMKLWNLTGIGFDKSGRILYTSNNLLTRLGLVEPIVGKNIKILLCHGSDKILEKVFKDKVMRWVGYIDIQKPSGKDTVSILWNGKILSDSEGNEMYLGYMEMKDAIYYNPGGIFWNKEVLVGADFKLLNRHLYIDLLLGYEENTSNDSFEHLHPLDILGLQNLDKQLVEHGYSEHVFRLLCNSNSPDDVRWLIVLTKMYPFQTQSGELILVTYSWPFAFSKDGSDNAMQSKNIVDGLEFIRNNDAWLSLIPSFLTSSPHQPPPGPGSGPGPSTGPGSGPGPGPSTGPGPGPGPGHGPPAPSAPP